MISVNITTVMMMIIDSMSRLMLVMMRDALKIILRERLKRGLTMT